MNGSTIAQLAVKLGSRVAILDALLPLYGGNPFNLKGIHDKITYAAGILLACARQGRAVNAVG